MSGIDYNRGVRYVQHPAGFFVYMYVDQPGVYLDPRGHIISEKVAAEAGFDVDQLALAKRRQALTAEALADIERKFGEVPEGVPVFEQAGYQVVRQGSTTFGIKDPDGNMLTKAGLVKAEAVKLAKRLANAEEDEPPQPEELTDGEKAKGRSRPLEP